MPYQRIADENTAREPHPTNRAMAAAWRRGFNDCKAGKARANPYPDIMNSATNTFSRAFRKYWYGGYDAALRGEEMQ